jgi:hypothetical protein
VVFLKFALILSWTSENLPSYDLGTSCAGQPKGRIHRWRLPSLHARRRQSRRPISSRTSAFCTSAILIWGSKEGEGGRSREQEIVLDGGLNLGVTACDYLDPNWLASTKFCFLSFPTIFCELISNMCLLTTVSHCRLQHAFLEIWNACIWSSVGESRRGAFSKVQLCSGELQLPLYHLCFLKIWWYWC